MGQLNVPVEFEGTEEEARANYKTHFFCYFDPEDGGRCSNCDCRPSHAAAKYPCGTEPPRRIIEVPQR